MVEEMSEDNHSKAVSYLVSNCGNLAVLSVLAYGSYARGDYKPESDIDLLVVLDSTRYSSNDLRSLIDICKFCKKEFRISLEMDILLDSEIGLWNRGILLDGHSFIDLSFYNKEGKVLFGTDVRNRFKLPADIKEKAYVVLGIIEAEFKRWFCQQEEEVVVPHWMTGWLLVTLLNTIGIVDVAGFNETCALIEKIPSVAGTHEFKKYRMKRELETDEFIRLYRAVKSHVQTQGEVNT
jgi:predicted nucleotidyltransferase